jgi:ubiquinone/menaquinone biosynthesis C-methylase UbiE
MAIHAQSHQSDPRILGRRTLERDHPHLAGLLQPGFSVLDAGCGTGAITVGIATAVGPRGFVVGIDRDAGLLDIARREHGDVLNLRFVRGDATGIPFHARFDVVTAARTLQWIGNPGLAVVGMRDAAKSSGMLVVLDYNHIANKWEPDPPVEFQKFYRAFLAWRKAHRWDNEMAERLPALFQSAGLIEVESHVQDEIAERGEPEFSEHADLWSQVIENVGEQVANEGFFERTRLQEVAKRYRDWAQTKLLKQTLAMRTVVGRVATHANSPDARFGSPA